jgi:proteic killer suppression protein
MCGEGKEMIESFGDDETKRVFNGESPSVYPPDILGAAYRKLIALSAALNILDMATPPANRLEKLKGQHDDVWSVRINKQWRLVFRWNSGVATDVRITDYHSGKDKL